MRTMLLCAFLILAAALSAQSVDELHSRCLPTAPISTLRAIIHVESNDNPNAMQIDSPRKLLKRWKLPEGTLRLKRPPNSQPEALEWLKYFERNKIYIDLGLMQVSTAEAQRRGIPPASLLDPCTNLRVGWQILEDAYQIETKKYGPGQLALQHAISRYNTGDTQQGIDNGYVGRVLAAVHDSLGASLKKP
jgi:type IV secretion system protein VirB1